MTKKEDPRVKRTKEALMNGLMDLIKEGLYQEISVSRIVSRAGVNRSTFYLHFLDKEDILEQMENLILQELQAALTYPSYSYRQALRAFLDENTPIKSLIDLFKHVEAYKELYKYL